VVTTNRNYIILIPDFSKCNRDGVTVALKVPEQQIVATMKSRETEGRWYFIITRADDLVTRKYWPAFSYLQHSLPYCAHLTVLILRERCRSGRNNMCFAVTQNMVRMPHMTRY
jgi:hypothetical protein